MWQCSSDIYSWCYCSWSCSSLVHKVPHRVLLVFLLVFYSMEWVSADFEGHEGLLEEYLCGDVQGIYIPHVFVYEFLVLRCTGYLVRAKLIFYLVFHSMDWVSIDYEGHEGLLEQYLCCDAQGIYSMHVFVYEVVVPLYIVYCVRVQLVFLLAFYSMDWVSADFEGP